MIGGQWGRQGAGQSSSWPYFSVELRWVRVRGHCFSQVLSLPLEGQEPLTAHLATLYVAVSDRTCNHKWDNSSMPVNILLQSLNLFPLTRLP